MAQPRHSRNKALARDMKKCQQDFWQTPGLSPQSGFSWKAKTSLPEALQERWNIWGEGTERGR